MRRDTRLAISGMIVPVLLQIWTFLFSFFFFYLSIYLFKNISERGNEFLYFLEGVQKQTFFNKIYSDNQNYPKAILILQANFKFYDKWKFDNN